MSVEQAIVTPEAIFSRYLDSLTREFGDKVLSSVVGPTNLTVLVDSSIWVDLMKYCQGSLGLTYFSFLSGIDWQKNPDFTSRYENIWGSADEPSEPESQSSDEVTAQAEQEAAVETGPEAVVETGLAGGNTRFQVFVRLFSPVDKQGIIFKTDVADVDPTLPTISGVFGGADWHERETWEMYGVWFNDHPNLIHIYLPGQFEGYPLRKDFPLLAREVKPWPGLTNVEPIAGDGEVSADESSEG